jgi:hypothetical protein
MSSYYLCNSLERLENLLEQVGSWWDSNPEKENEGNFQRSVEKKIEKSFTKVGRGWEAYIGKGEWVGMTLGQRSG